MAQFKVELELSIPRKGWVVIEAETKEAALALADRFIEDGELTDSLILDTVQFDRESNLVTVDAKSLEEGHLQGAPINEGSKFVGDIG
jgi:hypothetical protein